MTLIIIVSRPFVRARTGWTVPKDATSPHSSILCIFLPQIQLPHSISHTLLPCFLPLHLPRSPVTVMFLHADTQSLAVQYLTRIHRKMAQMRSCK